MDPFVSIPAIERVTMPLLPLLFTMWENGLLLIQQLPLSFIVLFFKIVFHLAFFLEVDVQGGQMLKLGDSSSFLWMGCVVAR